MKKLTLVDWASSSNKYPERLKSPEYTDEVKKNAQILLDKVNALLEELGVDSVTISSGFRPSAVNASVGGAKKSNHLDGHALDLVDYNGSLRDLFLKNLELAKKYGIHFEDFRWTPGWVHAQDKVPGSKKRIFVPSSAPATAPKAWSGKYDSKFD